MDRPPPAKKSKTQPRRYGFACLNCRRRKAKCDGAFPTCGKCINNEEECNYHKRVYSQSVSIVVDADEGYRGPSVSYAVSLENQLQSYKDQFEQLRRATSNQRLAILEDFMSNEAPAVHQQRSLSDVTTELGDEARNRRSDSLARDPSGTIEEPEETSIGMDGEICFYGKTSLYHVEPREDGNEPPFHQDEPTQHDRAATERNQSTVSYSSPAFSVGHEFTVASVRSEISPEMFNDLLTAYWCLPHHLHLVLCKPLFLRWFSLSNGPQS